MKNVTKFIILSYPRCGTHLVRTSLMSHDSINARGEYFGKVKKYLNTRYKIEESSIQEIYNNAFIPNTKDQAATGFCIHRIHHDDAMFLECMYTDKDLKIIFLDRENHLRRFISEEISIKTNKWVQQNNDKNITTEDTTIEFNKDNFLRNINVYNEKKEFYLNKFSGHIVYYTTYEKLVSNFKIELDSIQEFLNVPNINLLPTTDKMTVRPLSEIVTNYKYMCAFLKDNNLDFYLDDTYEIKI